MNIVYTESYLAHYGIPGQKWGVRRYQNEDGTWTEAGKERRQKSVFISGSSKTQSEDSGYYRKNLPKQVTNAIDKYISDGKRILVGDAPGIDRQVQDYLNSKSYRKVSVYGPGKSLRYLANSKWQQKPIDAPEFKPGSPEWLAKKDEAMTRDADEGFAVILDEGSKATKKNIERLASQGKKSTVFELSKEGSDYDKFVDYGKEVFELINSSSHLAHHGIKGQKWGVRRYQNEDGSLTPAGEKRYRKRQKKQEHHDALVSMYTDEGYSKDQAEKKATRQQKIETAAKVGLAVVGTALVSYGAYRLSDEYLDRTIKAGEAMYTTHHGDGLERITKSPFYMSWKDKDVNSYTSTKFSRLDKNSVVTKFTSNKDLKLASSGSQRKAYKELMKSNKDFKDFIEKAGGLRTYGTKGDAKDDFNLFSYMLVKRNDPTASKKTIENIDKYYDFLKKKGYSGVIDRKDSLMEKWTSNPGIIFDNKSLKYDSTKPINMAEAAGRKVAADHHADIREALLDTSSVAVGAGFASVILGQNLIDGKIADKKYKNKQS